MGKGKKGWQTRQEYIRVGLSSLTSWFLWKSFKRTRKVFPLKSLQEGMVLSTSSFHCQSCPRDYRLHPPNHLMCSQRVSSALMFPEGVTITQGCEQPDAPPYSPRRPLILRQWLRQQQFLSPDYRKVLPSNKGTGLPPIEWVRMVHIWIQNCCAINFYQKAQNASSFWQENTLIIF